MRQFGTMDEDDEPDLLARSFAPGGYARGFVRVATVIIALAATAIGLQWYVQARYEARLAAGLVRPGAPPTVLGKDDAGLKGLLDSLESLYPAAAPAPAAKVAAVHAPARQTVQQPALKLRPPLRGPVDIAGDGEAQGRLIWLSGAYRPGDPRLVSVVAAGDVMMGSAWPSPSGLNPELKPGTDAATIVGQDLAGIFRSADVAFVNLEGTLHDGHDRPTKSCANCFSFRSPEFYAGILASLGIDVVSMANNHSGDFGRAGRNTTIAALHRAGIAAAGLTRPDARTASLVLPDGRHVGVVAFAPNEGTLNLNNIPAAKAIVRKLAAANDLVLVSFHGGAEGWDAVHVHPGTEYYLGENRGNVEAFAHAMIDAGASLVVGQGPHVPRAMQLYHGHLIAYSLGNFWTYGVVLNYAVSGLGPVLETWLAPDGTLAGLQIRSTRQAGLGIPHLDRLGEAARYMQYLTRSDFPATETALSRRSDLLAARTTRSPGS